MTWKITRFATPLRVLGALGNTHLVERVGFHVEVHDRQGRIGHGEASPPYWIDGSDLQALEDELRTFAHKSELERFLAGMGRINPDEFGLSAAARCGIETAALDLVAQQHDCSVAEWLGGSGAATLDTSALVGGETAAQVYDTTLARVRDGFRVVKLKVGGHIAEDDVARIQAAREATRGAALLRLDANRAWDYPTAFAVLIAVANPDLELVEEPLRGSHPVELARLRRATGVPVAMDESVVSIDALTTLAECGACDTIVLKLARVGGPHAALAMALRARELGLRVVWTDSIESPIGRQATVHTAAAMPGPCEAVGLGGAALLLEPGDVGLQPRVRVCGPGLGLSPATA